MSATTESHGVRNEMDLSRRFRTSAVAHAVRRDLPAAFEQLESSWTLDRASATEAGTDVAWLHLVAGNPGSALAMLSIVTRRRRGMTDGVRALIAACVALDRTLWVRALVLCLARGSALDRVRAAAAVVGARLGRRDVAPAELGLRS